MTPFSLICSQCGEEFYAGNEGELRELLIQHHNDYPSEGWSMRGGCLEFVGKETDKNGELVRELRLQSASSAVWHMFSRERF